MPITTTFCGNGSSLPRMPIARTKLPQPETRTQMFISGVEITDILDKSIHARISTRARTNRNR
jgi:hypothetical protein